MAWLNDHPPARSQYRHPRREAVSGVIVIHTAENTPDTTGTDGGAEAVARFIQGRDTPGSYHRLADSDSVIPLVELGDEAFHDGTGTNPHSIGLSVATRAELWSTVPAEWAARAVANLAGAAAEAAAYVKAQRGIVVPARRITVDQARARVPGFLSHAELDPTRRTDPGKAFPWAAFLTTYAQLTDQGDDLDMDDAHFKDLVRAVLNEGTAPGQSGWAGTSSGTLQVVQGNNNKLDELLTRVRALHVGNWVDQAGRGDLKWLDEKLKPIKAQLVALDAKVTELDTVDPAALAAAVAGAIPDGLAVAVALELAKRLET